MQGIRPTGNRVLLKRIDGDGREELTAGGIWKPARDESLRHGNAARVPDTFRAQVLAVGDGAAKATQGELQIGQTVLVHTYDTTSDRTLAAHETSYGILVDVGNILGIEDDEDIKPCPYPEPCALHLRTLPSSVADLGFHRRRGGF